MHGLHLFPESSCWGAWDIWALDEEENNADPVWLSMQKGEGGTEHGKERVLAEASSCEPASWTVLISRWKL